MKTIITAIGEQKLNEELKKYETIKVLTTDIQYKEGILEVLENEENIDILIFNEEIQGEIEFEDLIDTIKLINKKIEIIIILQEENLEKIQYLKNKNITKIFFKNNIDINKIINEILKKDNYEIENELIKKISEENIKIKDNINLKNNYEMQYEKNNVINIKLNKKNRTKKILNKINNIFKKKKIIKKIITITGVSGVGKSIFTANIANSYSNGKNKILIIDFDILNNCIHTLFGVNKYPKNIKENLEKEKYIQEFINNNINIKKLIIKINNKIDLISGIDLILKNKKWDINDFYYILEELQKDYNLILIDTSNECLLEYSKIIMKCSDNVIFLLEGNLLQIKKSINLLNTYTNNWNINNEKINIIVNKKTNESIEENVLKNIFSDFYILGNLNFNKIYNVLINKNMNRKILNRKLKKEYKLISQKILKENNVYKFNLEKKTS